MGYVGQCALDKITTSVADVLKDRKFLPGVDGRAAIELSHAMYVPVLNSTGECVLVVELLNKASGPFGPSDEQVCVSIGIVCRKSAPAMSCCMLSTCMFGTAQERLCT